MKRLIRRVTAAAVLLVAVSAPTTASAAVSANGTLAWFEDHWIDLSVDWEEATACDVGPTGIVCYRSEKELSAAARRRASSSSAVGTMALYCGSSLKLYDGISYTGNMLALNLRFTPLNLSAYGFDNVTTSYKVGACDVELYAGPNLTGSTYPGNTAVYAQSSSMSTGWNNLVSSVYIY